MSENFCYSCRFYHPYYTKGYKMFDKQDIGLCGNKKITVEKHNNSCEHFQYKYYARKSPKNAALEALAESLNTIAEIKQILEEDDEEALQAFLIERNLQKKKERERKK